MTVIKVSSNRYNYCCKCKIKTAQVSVTYPKPGETPDTVATVPDGANYTAEVTWEHNGTEVTGNFEYDKAYDAIITVKPKTGYAL